MNGWIGVDLDGTLAFYEHWNGPEHIGAPIAPMLDRVKRWRSMECDVRIFTARISHDNTLTRILDARKAQHAIEKWCMEHLGEILPITNVKDYAMIELWDDRCVQVTANTGQAVGVSTRGL